MSVEEHTHPCCTSSEPRVIYTCGCFTSEPRAFPELLSFWPWGRPSQPSDSIPNILFQANTEQRLTLSHQPLTHTDPINLWLPVNLVHFPPWILQTFTEQRLSASFVSVWDEPWLEHRQLTYRMIWRLPVTKGVLLSVHYSIPFSLFLGPFVRTRNLRIMNQLPSTR